MMPSDIADEMGLSVNQVNYALRKLQEYDLVHRVTQGWYLTKMTTPELEQLFEDVAGKGDARAEKYREERRVFAGVILFNSRIRGEGKKFMSAVSEQVVYHRQMQEMIDDPLILMGLELGGVVRPDRVH